MFISVRRFFTLFAAIFLLVIFFLPSGFLKSRVSALQGLNRELIQAVDEGNGDETLRLLTEIEILYAKTEPTVEFFLDHTAVDAASLPLSLMRSYFVKGDDTSLRASAVEFSLALEHILSIEAFNVRMFF